MGAAEILPGTVLPGQGGRVMIKFYGSQLCPDCRAALSQLQGKGTPHEFVEITASLENLKAFLNLRDQSAAFEGVKAAGGIGIPAFVREDGTVTLDPASL